MNNPLPKAKSFVFIDQHLPAQFEARGKRIDLDRITNAQIKQLLEEDANYWGQKFQLKKKAKATEEQAEESAEEPQ
ncbi:MAG: hypothetical protein AAFP77_19725 [Bacteroidota bacterium]